MALWRERALLAAAAAQRPPARCGAARRPASLRGGRGGLSEPGRAAALRAAGPAARPAAAAPDRHGGAAAAEPVARTVPRRLFRPAAGGARRRPRARGVRGGVARSASTAGCPCCCARTAARPASSGFSPGSSAAPAATRSTAGSACWRPSDLRRELAALPRLPAAVPGTGLGGAAGGDRGRAVRAADHRPAGPRRRRDRPSAFGGIVAATPADLPAGAAGGGRGARRGTTGRVTLDRLAGRRGAAARPGSRRARPLPAGGAGRRRRRRQDLPAERAPSAGSMRPACRIAMSGAAFATTCPSRCWHWPGSPATTARRSWTASAPAITTLSAARGWPGRSCASR